MAMDVYVRGFDEVDRTQVALVGGKGAHLGELSRIEDIHVPPGFCVTTDAFRRTLAGAPSIDDRLDRLSRLRPEDADAIRALSAEVRTIIEGIAIPDDVAAAITGRLDQHAAYAVRSSATAEDQRTASSAGQQDSFLDVRGPADVLRHISRCWASLFTERAVTYRLHRGVERADVRMAVVVQEMVHPQAAGVLFTADPVSSDRTVTVVEAVVGLGDALVSGTATPDTYAVRDGRVDGAPERADQPVLTAAQVLELARVGRRIEAHLGHPQDIEWCLVGDDVHIVQSRPITTLFPVPATDDGATHVYVSVGHQQMMTDAMTPLGISVWQLTSPAPMVTAGGRLFVDITRGLASPVSRAALVDGLGRSDPLIGDALRTILDRGDLTASLPDAGPGAGAAPAGGPPAPIEADPAIVTELIDRTQDSLAALRREIRGLSGPALLDFILADVEELRRILFDPRSHQVVMAGMEATWWLDEQLQAWLGERNAADVLAQSVPHNVTSEMGLALLDVADVIRPHPEVVAFLQGVEPGDEDFLDRLPGLAGGQEAHDAIRAYLDAYGMRCVGEIDIARPRWSERPTALVPVLLRHVANAEPGAGRRRFEQGREEAQRAERELLERLRALPDGEVKAAEAKRMIDRVRAFTGYREHPKYGMVSRYAIYRRALWQEAGRLVGAQVLGDPDDIAYLTFQELHDVVRTHRVDDQLIRRRRAEHRWHQALVPPRVLTSGGEAVAGAYRRDDVPAGALVGLGVSAGTVEGRARVVLDMAEADLDAGDILVTAYTDPSWTPAFVAIAGLVTEVGGLMTHGAVVAREYGLPAVVGVEHATQLILDGQQIRVHGRDGYVEVLA